MPRTPQAPDPVDRGVNGDRPVDLDKLSELAEHLRALHQVGNPLVLVNAWDAASARQVEGAGAAAIGTTSAAVAASLGVPDDNTMGPLAFDAVRRIAAHASVPVTADLEGGYDMSGRELVDGLLGAGAVGCNVEDSDHRTPGTLRDAEGHAARLSEIRSAASSRGVDIVLNARIDTVIHDVDGDLAAVFDETERRARLYLEAGADCVYPIRLTDLGLIARLTEELAAPVNANLGPSVTVQDVTAAGVSRLSIGPMAHVRAMADLGRRAERLHNDASATLDLQ
jgi:2-methylisocitrate lyase-like PEP mutase family enzyme